MSRSTVVLVPSNAALLKEAGARGSPASRAESISPKRGRLSQGIEDTCIISLIGDFPAIAIGTPRQRLALGSCVRLADEPHAGPRSCPLRIRPKGRGLAYLPAACPITRLPQLGTVPLWPALDSGVRLSACLPRPGPHIAFVAKGPNGTPGQKPTGARCCGRSYADAKLGWRNMAAQAALKC